MNHQQGNVLFLILIAVALFAALSYAVTSSTRSGGGDASREKISTQISATFQRGVALRTAVLRMTQSFGVAPENLLFDPPANFSALTPGEIPREVFHPQGGGMTYEPGWIVTSGFEVTGNGLSDIGNPTKSSEIIALQSVSRDMCLEINRKLGINISEAYLDLIIDVVTTNFDDNMDRNHPGINGGVNGFFGAIGSDRDSMFAPFDNTAQGCFYNGASDVYLYYDVLVAR